MTRHQSGELRNLWRDARFAVRGFRRAPAFAATVILTIALALGLNTTAFTVFDAYVLRPIAARDPHALYALGWLDRAGRGRPLAWGDYDAARALPVVADAFAYRRFLARVGGRPLFGVAATPNALGMLGAPVALGRPLARDDADAIVLSHDAWRGPFGGDSAAVGRRVLVRGAALTVVGVLAPGAGAFGATPPDFWVPLAAGVDGGPDPRAPGAPPSLGVVLRVRHGVRERDAAAALGPWAAARDREAPDTTSPARRPRLTPLATALPRDPETLALLLPVLAAFGLVLLIACVNVTNVMLARALARRREIGIRLALGAGRGRLLRQLLVESLLLALPAAALGYALSRWSVEAGVRLLFASMPAEYAPYARVVPLAPDVRVFAFLLAAAVGSALLFGLGPAIRATRPRATARGAEAARPGRLRAALVVGQITVCALLLVTTGVLLRGAARARRLETGVRAADVVQLRLDDRWRAAAIARLGAEPGVRLLAASRSSPLDGSFPTAEVQALGTTRVETAAWNAVSRDYFAVLGLTVRGRAFADAEGRSVAPVAVVSEAAAARLWPGRDAVGQSLAVADGGRRRVVEVVGVARNAVSGWIGTGLDRPVVYLPAPLDAPGAQLLARVAPDAGGVARARDRLDAALGTTAPSAVEEIHALDEYLAVQLYPFRALAWVAGALGAVALALTVLGVYGVLSYVVTQRAREIGVRLALGARRAAVVGLVLRQVLGLAAVGVPAGAALALGASWLIGSALVVVNGFDPLGYVGGAAAILGACLAAAYVPSRRAAMVDPVIALRAED